MTFTEYGIVISWTNEANQTESRLSMFSLDRQRAIKIVSTINAIGFASAALSERGYAYEQPMQ